MKKKFLATLVTLLMVLVMLPAANALAADITINATNFPDANFRTAVEAYDTNTDSTLQDAEIAVVTAMNVSNLSIADLTGIQYFTALTNLNCGSNELAALDLGGLTALTYLYCQNNRLTALDVTDTVLTEIYCTYNWMPNEAAVTGFIGDPGDFYFDPQHAAGFIPVSGIAGLDTIPDSMAVGESIPLPTTVTPSDATKQTVVWEIDYSSVLDAAEIVGNVLTVYAEGEITIVAYIEDGLAESSDFNTYYYTITLLSLPPKAPADTIITDKFTDANFLAAIRDELGLGSSDNITAGAAAGIIALDVNSYNIASLAGIEYLVNLAVLDCNDNQLTELDLSGNIRLGTLYCNSNLLTSLTLTGLTNLVDLDCDDNQLTSLVLTGLTHLEYLDCGYNRLTSLDLSGPANLKELRCSNNQLTSLNLTGLTGLIELDCEFNLLTSLDATGTAPETIYCSYNYMTDISDVTAPATTDVYFDPQHAAGFVSVNSITGTVPGIMYIGSTLKLPTVVYPDNATNQDVEWFIDDFYPDDSAYTGDGVFLVGNTLTALELGWVQIVAYVENGLGVGANFVRSYEIRLAVKPTPPTPTPDPQPLPDPEPYYSGGCGWTKITAAAKSLADGATLDITMNGTTAVPADFLAAIAGKNVNVTLNMGGNHIWGLNGKDVPTGSKAMNLGVITGGTTLDALVKAISGNESYTQLNITMNGALPFAMTLSVPLGAANANKFANLYFYNETTKALEFKQAPTIGSGGTAVFTLDHASTYAIIIGDASLAPAEWKNPFADVKKTDWFYADVEYVTAKGLFNGVSETAFSPQTTMTRGMAVTVLGRLAGIDIADYTGKSFDDVDTAKYYAPYVKWAAGLGIVNGIGDNKFAPESDISRQDLCVILANYAKEMKISLKQTLQAVVFVDSDSISGYAATAVELMASAGVVKGKPGNIFDPKGNAARAEVAAMFHRFCEAIK